MVDRWSPLDRAIYGAEDDDEMDMILRHIDQAMSDDEAHGPARPHGESELPSEGKMRRE
jgi:hypothetical protein